MGSSGHGARLGRRWAGWAALLVALLIGVAQAQGAPGWLAARGVRLGGSDSETLLGNVAGGIKTGATLQGLTLVTLDINTNKAFGWQGGRFEASALQIHGRSLSPYYLGDLQTANGNEASDGTRLWTLWYDQRFDRGRVDIKIGQQSVDQEFIVSKSSGLFVNTMAGWPLLPSVDLYAGGPAYPLSSLGVRLRVKPRRDVTVLLGVFDDNPPGGSFYHDPQSLDAGGVAFNTTTGALVMGELDDRADWAGLRGAYKIGFWYDSGRFPVPGIARNGMSLAGPLSAGGAAYKRHDYSVYGVVDQTVWASPSVSARRLDVFGRVMAAPGGRNLIGFSFNGGVTLRAPLAGRDHDQAGIDVGIGQVGSAMVAYDRAIGAYSGTAYPVQGVETLIEATYQAQINRWWQVQPDIQYVINPGAGIPNPAEPGRRLANELVVGVRGVITF